MPLPDLRRVWMPAAILALSAFLNLSNLGFPLGYHADEPKKVFFITTGLQDFRHPILMLQVVRAANLGFRWSEPQQTVLLGRGVVALCGTLTVLLSYLLAKRAMGPAAAAGVALSVAVSPTLVIHAHYLKEDTVLVTGLLASILCFLRFVRRVDGWSTLWLGLATGLACSTHYKAILLPFLYLMAREEPRRTAGLGRFYAGLAGAMAIATAVFLAVNWPLLRAWPTFVAGVSFDVDHVLVGHDERITWSDYYLGFHLLHSLAPGMGWPALVVALGGLLWTLARWRRAGFHERWLVAYVVVFYFVPELSPLKPAPGYSRYMLPVVPPLLYLAWSAIEGARRRVPDRIVAALLLAMSVGALVVSPLYITSRLLLGMSHDTRDRAAEWLKRNPGKALFEQYGRPGFGSSGDVWTLTALDLTEVRRQGVDYLVASSLLYERFYRGSRLANQGPEIYETHRRYVELFERPYVEIAPDFRTFAFSNPVIRIIDLREPPSSTTSRRPP